MTLPVTFDILTTVKKTCVHTGLPPQLSTGFILSAVVGSVGEEEERANPKTPKKHNTQKKPAAENDSTKCVPDPSSRSVIVFLWLTHGWRVECRYRAGGAQGEAVQVGGPLQPAATHPAAAHTQDTQIRGPQPPRLHPVHHCWCSSRSAAAAKHFKKIYIYIYIFKRVNITLCCNDIIQ